MERKDEKVPVDVLQVMKTQDLRYVSAKNQQEKVKIDRLKATLHLVGKEALPEKQQHTVFVDDEKDGELVSSFLLLLLLL